MQTSDTWSVVLDYPEALALASLLQIPQWPGLALPEDTLPGDLQQLFEQGWRGLVDKKYLAADPRRDGAPVLFSGLARLLGAVRQPWIILALYPGDSNLARWVFIRPSEMVEQELRPDGQVSLTAVRDLDLLRQRVAAYLGLAADLPTPGQAFALEVKPGAQPSQQWLAQAGAPEGAIQPVLALLSGERQPARLAVVDPINPSRAAQTLAWVAGPAGCWRVSEAAGAGNLRRWTFQPAAIRDLRAEVLAFFVQPVAD